jgi:hypothetical protein
MADNLTPVKETAIVNNLETTLRNPDATNTGEIFQQQLGSLSQGDQLKIVNQINQDKQTEGYGTGKPLPELTLHDDGVVTEKIAGNDTDLTVWRGSLGANAGADLKAPRSYTGTLENGGVVPATEAFASDLTHDPAGALKAAGITIADVVSATKNALLGPVQAEISKIPGA